MSGHTAPWRSVERTAYFEGLMRQYAVEGPRYLTFTPPSTRGSLLTNTEAWALNLQRRFVPTLSEEGRWPPRYALEHPDNLTQEQQTWLTQRWGECAALWAKSGCPLVAPY